MFLSLSSVIYDVHSSLLDTYSRRAVIIFQLTALGNDTQEPGLTPQEQPGGIQDLYEEVYLINEGRPDDYIMQHYYKPGPSLFYYLLRFASQILRYFASV